MKQLKSFYVLTFSILTAAIIAGSAVNAADKNCKHFDKNCMMCPYYGSSETYDAQMLNALQKTLGLADEQVKSIFDIDTKYRELYFKNRNSAEKMKELKNEHKKEINSVFTPEQLDALQLIHKSHHGEKKTNPHKKESHSQKN